MSAALDETFPNREDYLTMRRLMTLLIAVMAAFGCAAVQADAATFADATSLSLAPEISADFDRAAQYWGAAPACRHGIKVTYNEARTGASAMNSVTYAGRALGCDVAFGDYYLSESPLERCRDTVHEWGHLLGHLHVPSGDPDNIMPYWYADGTMADPENLTAPTHINTAWTCHVDPSAITADAEAMVTAAWRAIGARHRYHAFRAHHLAKERTALRSARKRAARCHKRRASRCVRA